MSTLLGEGGYSTILEVRSGLKRLQNGTVDFPFIVEDKNTDEGSNVVNLAEDSDSSVAVISPINEITSEGTSEGTSEDTSDEELSVDERLEIINALNAAASDSEASSATPVEDFEGWELDSSDEEDVSPATTGSGDGAGKKERQTIQMRLAASQRSYDKTIKANADEAEQSRLKLLAKLNEKKEAAKAVFPGLDLQTPHLLGEVNNQLSSVVKAYDSKIDSANKAFDEKFNSPTYKTDGSGNIVKNAKGKEQFEFKPLEEVEWQGRPALLIESKKGAVFDLPKEGDRILDMVWPAGVWSRKLTFTKGGNPTFYTKDDAKGHKKGDPKLDKNGNPLLTKDKTDLYIKFTPTQPYTLQRDDGSGSTVVGPDEEQKYIQFRTFDTQLLYGKPYQPAKKVLVPFLKEWFQETASRNNLGDATYKHYFAPPQLKDFTVGMFEPEQRGDQYITAEELMKEAFERAKAEWSNPAKKDVNALVQERNEKVKVLNMLKSALEKNPEKLQNITDAQNRKNEEAKRVKDVRDKREEDREANYVAMMEAKRERREKREKERDQARLAREERKLQRKEKYKAKLEATRKFNEDRERIKEEFTRNEAAVKYPPMPSLEEEDSNVRKEAMKHKDKAIARFVPGTELFRRVQGKKKDESTYTEKEYYATVKHRGVTATGSTYIDVEYKLDDASIIARYCVVGTVRKHGFHWERAELLERENRTSQTLLKDRVRVKRSFNPPRFKIKKDGTRVEQKKVVVKDVKEDVKPSKYVQSGSFSNSKPLKRWSASEKAEIDADNVAKVAVPFEVGREYCAAKSDGDLSGVVRYKCVSRDSASQQVHFESLDTAHLSLNVTVDVVNKVERVNVGGVSMLSTSNIERFQLRQAAIQRRGFKQAFERKVKAFVDQWKSEGATIGDQAYEKDAAKTYTRIDLATYAHSRLQNMGVAPASDYGDVALDEDLKASIENLGKLKFSSKTVTAFDMWYNENKESLSEDYIKYWTKEAPPESRPVDEAAFILERVTATTGIVKPNFLLVFANSKWDRVTEETKKQFESKVGASSGVDLLQNKQNILSALKNCVNFDSEAMTLLVDTLLNTKVLLRAALASLSVGENVNETVIGSLQHGFFMWLQQTIEIAAAPQSRAQWHKQIRKKIGEEAGATDEETRAVEDEDRLTVNKPHRAIVSSILETSTSSNSDSSEDVDIESGGDQTGVDSSSIIEDPEDSSDSSGSEGNTGGFDVDDIETSMFD